jgi:DNA gyrase inhibitor GyrI
MESYVKYFFLTVIVGILGLVTYLYFYLGASKPVEVAVQDKGTIYLLYSNHTGAYHYINATIEKVEAWARLNGVFCRQTFGEFLDDPQSVDEDRLRSHAGCVLDRPIGSLPHEPFIYEERKPGRYAVAAFTGSPAIGPFKVYPKVRKFLNEKRLRSSAPVVEIYTINGDSVRTEYLFPL